MDRHVAHFFEGAAATLPTSSRSAGGRYLQASCVGHQSLASVNGPAVRRSLQAREGLNFSGLEELEVARVRVGELAGATREQLGKSFGSFWDRGHGQACYACCWLCLFLAMLLLATRAAWLQLERAE